MELKELIKKNYSLYAAANWLMGVKQSLMGGVKIENHGNGRIMKDVIGKNNLVQIGKGSMIHKCRIRIRGNHNTIVIGEDCKIMKNCSFWILGNNCSIILGNHVTMQHSNHFQASEDGMSITVGNDCMFSNNIIVRTSDNHGIFDADTKQRLNEADHVKIGNHVWIAPNSRIYKGSNIEDGVIVGSNTLVTKRVPSNTLVVGMPSHVVKENVVWSRHMSL